MLFRFFRVDARGSTTPHHAAPKNRPTSVLLHYSVVISTGMLEAPAPQGRGRSPSQKVEEQVRKTRPEPERAESNRKVKRASQNVPRVQWESEIEAKSILKV